MAEQDCCAEYVAGLEQAQRDHMESRPPFRASWYQLLLQYRALLRKHQSCSPHLDLSGVAPDA